MKKIGVPVLAVLAALLLPGSCGNAQKAADERAAARHEDSGVRTLLARYMPQAMADGIVKIAVVRGRDAEDHSRQFLDGCVSEGRAMGFTVDVFLTNGDTGRCWELIAKISQADYDGLVLYYDSAGLIYDFLRPAAEKGIKIVTFEALPFKKDGVPEDILPGLTSTSQNDARLARLSLEDIVSRFGSVENPSGKPVRVIRVWPGPGILSQDRRNEVYERFIQEGKITETALIRPQNMAFVRTSTREALAAILPDFHEGSVDVIWAPYGGFARGCMDALEAAGRQDIRLVSIDISNQDIHLMLNHPAVWIAAAAVDPRLAGIVNMRLLAAKLAGEPTPGTFMFEPQIIQTAALDRTANMAKMALVVPGWGPEADAFDGYPWMAELKAAVGKHPRLLPVVSAEPAAQ